MTRASPSTPTARCTSSTDGSPMVAIRATTRSPAGWRERIGMNALRQTVSSIRHRPSRALLTALGTALGIGTIVALLAVSAGATQTAGMFVDLGRSDLGLFQKDAADPTTSVLSTSLIGALRRQPWVADAMGLQLLVSDIAKSPAAIVFGAEPN